MGSQPENYEHVNHPTHYNDHPSGVECIDVIRHMTFNVGAAIKYLWRMGKKPGESTLRDLDKAIFYLQNERDRIADVVAVETGAKAREQYNRNRPLQEQIDDGSIASALTGNGPNLD